MKEDCHQTLDSESTANAFEERPYGGFVCQRINVPYFPPGYKFKPTDEELIVSYLMKKLRNEPLPFNEIMKNVIRDVEVYNYNPDMLVENYKNSSEKEWYFFTPQERKYRNGKRLNRKAGDGFWKANGKEEEIKSKGQVVGFKRVLTYFRAEAPRAKKSDWILHEYRIRNATSTGRTSTNDNDMRFDDVVLCRMYNKAYKFNVNPQSQNKEDSKAANSTDAQCQGPMDTSVALASNHCQSNIDSLSGCYGTPLVADSLYAIQHDLHQSANSHNIATVMEEILASTDDWDWNAQFTDDYLPEINVDDYFP